MNAETRFHRDGGGNRHPPESSVRAAPEFLVSACEGLGQCIMGRTCRGCGFAGIARGQKK